jgi:hypothetical protein
MNGQVPFILQERFRQRFIYEIKNTFILFDTSLESGSVSMVTSE